MSWSTGPSPSGGCTRRRFEADVAAELGNGFVRLPLDPDFPHLEFADSVHLLLLDALDQFAIVAVVAGACGASNANPQFG